MSDDAKGGARTSATVDVNGLPMFYETVGTGSPIVLLHGGMATNSTWNAQFTRLAPRRRVIAAERQAHGHTPDRDGPLTYDSMVADTAAHLRAIGLGPLDLVGWSDGGMVGLRLAIEHPELVRTLSTFGSGFSSDGYVPGSIQGLTHLPADHEELAVFATMYAETSPDGAEHFPVVWDKVRAMWDEPFDWSHDLAQVVAPVLVIVADDDYVTVSHAEQFARGVSRGQLAVIPGASHLAPMEKPSVFNKLVLDFTDNPTVDSLMPLWRRDH